MAQSSLFLVPDPDDFAPLLRAALIRRRLSQSGLASRVGVSANTVSNWTRGRFEPSRRHLVAIADALEVDLDELAPQERAPSALDPTVNALAQLDLEDTLTALRALTPDLLAVLAEAKRRAAS